MVPFEPVICRRHIFDNPKETKMNQYKRFSAAFVALVAWMALAIPIPGSAQATNLGARTETSAFAASTHSLSVTIVNTSAKDISAYNISVDTTYQDGTQRHQERAVDLLPLMLSQQTSLTKASALRSGALHPGGTLQENITVFTASAARPISHVEAVVDAVIYTDRTAEATNDGALTRLVAIRKDRLRGEAQAFSILQNEIKMSSADPAAASITKIKQIMADSRETKSGGLAAGLLSIISDLGSVAKLSAQLKTSSGDYLERYLSEKEQQTMILALHTQIERVK
jgi:hypothetical protein